MLFQRMFPVIIHKFDEENQCLYPITVIECKNEKVLLTDNVSEQSIRYSDTIAARYIVVTNGIDLRFVAYDEDTESYMFLDNILSYGQMINKDYVLSENKEEKEIRFTFEELQNQELILQYSESGIWIFGRDTPRILRSLAVNLYQAFGLL